jgi:putative peptidoglycan lipid II flippase
MGIFALAVGVLGGGLFQVIFQIPWFRKSGYDLKLDFGFSSPEFKKVIRMWLPVVATSSVFAINQQIAIRFASGLEVGSTSALSYSIVIWQLPFGVFSASVTTVLFPKLSRQAASGDREGIIDSLSYGLRFLLLLLLPSAIFYVIMGEDIVGVVYQRGEFTENDTWLTARVLTGYSLGLFFVGSFTFLQRYFYASRDYRTPFIIAAVITVVDVLFSLWLKETYLRVVGLAVANSIAFTLGFFMMIYTARRKLGQIDGRKILRNLLRTVLALIPSSAILIGYWYLTRSFKTPFLSWGNLLILLGGFLVFFALTVCLYFLCRVDIIREILKRRANK